MVGVVVDGLEIRLVAEVERVLVERPAEQFDHGREQVAEKLAFLRRVVGGQELQVEEYPFAQGFVLYIVRVDQREIIGVVALRNFLHAAEINHAHGAVGAHQEIARMRVGVDFAQRMHLEIIEIPQGLPDGVAHLLRWVGFQEILHVQAVQPVHGQYPFAGKFGVVFREMQVRDVGAFGGDFLRTAQFQLVVRLLKQFGFHLVHVLVHVLFVEVHEPHGKWLDHFQIRTHTLRHARILHFHGQLPAVFGGAVYLPDGGRIGGFHVERIKQLLRRLAEIFHKRLDYQRPRQRRRTVLRHLELVGIGAWQQVAVHAHHLRHFQGTAFQLAQRVVDIRGVVAVQFIAREFGIKGFFGVMLDVIAAHLESGRDKLGGPLDFGGWNAVLGFHQVMLNG